MPYKLKTILISVANDSEELGTLMVIKTFDTAPKLKGTEYYFTDVYGKVFYCFDHLILDETKDFNLIKLLSKKR